MQTAGCQVEHTGFLILEELLAAEALLVAPDQIEIGCSGSGFGHGEGMTVAIDPDEMRPARAPVKYFESALIFHWGKRMPRRIRYSGSALRKLIRSLAAAVGVIAGWEAKG